MFASIRWDIVNEIGLQKQPFMLVFRSHVRIAAGLCVQPVFAGSMRIASSIWNENLAVADAPGFGGLLDGFDGLLDLVI